jgi:hypothetical protein
MFGRGRKDQKRFLLHHSQDLQLTARMILHIINLTLPKDEGLILDGPLLKGYPSCQVLDILHDEIYRNAVVSKPWDDDIGVDRCRQDEIAVCLLDEFVVLGQDGDDGTTALDCITLQPPAQPQVICICLGVPSQLMKIL